VSFSPPFFFFWGSVLLCSQAGLKLTVLLPQPSKYWDYRYEPPCPVSTMTIQWDLLLNPSLQCLTQNMIFFLLFSLCIATDCKIILHSLGLTIWVIPEQ
jgi:hypothetical protein